MQRVLESLFQQHDLRLLLIALVICAYGASAMVKVANRAAADRGFLWLFVLTICATATAWATHFVAILGYLGQVPTTYKPFLAGMSFMIGAGVMGAGFRIRFRPGGNWLARISGGGIVGLGAVLMHYLGTASLNLPGYISFDPDLTAVSAALGVGFGAIALVAGIRPGKPYTAVLGPLLMVLMMVTLYSAAMGALRVTLIPDSLPDPTGIPREMLLTIASFVSLFIILVGLVTSVLDARLAHQASISVSLLHASEARFRAIFDHAALGVSVIDADSGVLLDINAEFCSILGFERDELLGRVAGSLSPPEDAVIMHEPVQALRLGLRDSVNVEKRFIRSDGKIIWGNLIVSRVDGHTSAGREVLVGMLEEVTERKAMEAQLLHQAFHDPLTGLANRALFHDRVEHALTRLTTGRKRSGSSRDPDGPHPDLVVLFIDLDGFKHINDSLGHAYGDRLLVTAATRVANCLRTSDTVARLGGDEFAVLLEDNVNADDGTMVAERVLDALRAPIQLDGREVVISASVGIAQVWPGYDTDDLLRGADAAMYEAKTGGRDRYAVYNPEMHRRALERLQLESDLRIGLKLDQLEIHYQPLINLKSNQLYGAEALVRWRHRTLGLIAPDQFIPIAEETGLIVDLGFRVLRDACMQAAEWLESKRVDIHPSFFMSVNISSRQLQDPELHARVAQALEESGLPAKHLMLEVTESVVMQRVEFALECLNGLKHLGVRLAIDDFGTGYSSLSHLQRFPFDVLKIDKSFVDGISSTPEYAGAADKDASLVRTIVALGRALGLQVVAEGIEAGAQGRKLQALGCEIGQGFHYAHPLPANQFSAEYFADEYGEEAAVDGTTPVSIFVPS